MCVCACLYSLTDKHAPHVDASADIDTGTDTDTDTDTNTGIDGKKDTDRH